MKRLLAFLLLLVMFVATAVCQTVTPAAITDTGQIDFSTLFYSISALVAFIPFLMEYIKKIVTIPNGIITQIVSWLVGVILCFAGWYFKLGLFYGLLWYQVLIISIAIGLAANGFYKTEAVTTILKALKLIK